MISRKLIKDKSRHSYHPHKFYVILGADDCPITYIWEEQARLCELREISAYPLLLIYVPRENRESVLQIFKVKVRVFKNMKVIKCYHYQSKKVIFGLLNYLLIVDGFYFWRHWWSNIRVMNLIMIFFSLRKNINVLFIHCFPNHKHKLMKKTHEMKFIKT